MNSRTVDARTVWAVLAMEVGLILPLISLPTQGDRLPGVLGPFLLVLMLPLGYLAVHRLAELRDPSWRLPSGICIALVTRAIVSSVPEPGLSGVTVWLGHSVVPAAIGVALWWRGGGLDATELTAADVRREFSVLAVCMLLALAIVRPFLLPDPLLLGGSVGLFATGGLLATALARQDAAEAVSVRFARTLAVSTALLPVAAAVVLVSVLRPSLLGSMWSALANLVELALMPIAWLINWFFSLFPRGTPGPQAPLPPPPPRPLPDLASLGQAQDRVQWLIQLALVVILVAASVAVLLVVRLMLSNWIKPAPREPRDPQPALSVERSGTPGKDAHALLGWLLRWLRRQFGRSGGRTVGTQNAAITSETSAVDARAAYRGLLDWAEHEGLAREPAETTGQLQRRLARYAPDSAEAVDLVTSTYEWERYGAVHPPSDRIRRVQAALRALLEG